MKKTQSSKQFTNFIQFIQSDLNQQKMNFLIFPLVTVCFAFLVVQVETRYKIQSNDIAGIEAEIFQQCPQLLSQNILLEYKKTLYDATNFKLLEFSFVLNFIRFVEINDLTKTFTIYARILLSWTFHFPNCDFEQPDLFKNMTKVDPNFKLMDTPLLVKRKGAWVPDLTHANAVEYSQPLSE